MVPTILQLLAELPQGQGIARTFKANLSQSTEAGTPVGGTWLLTGLDVSGSSKTCSAAYC